MLAHVDGEKATAAGNGIELIFLQISEVNV